MSTKPLAKQVVPGANGAESANAQDGAVRARDSLFHWCGTAESLLGTPDRTGKRALLDAYFGAVAEQSIAPAARFFAGALLPRRGRAIGPSEPLIIAAIQDLTRVSADEIRARHVKAGDLGDTAAEIFAGRLPSGLAITDVAAWADALADATTDDARRPLIRDMLARVSSVEAGYIVRLMTGALQLGVDEPLIEDALATTFSQPIAAVRAANALRGDIGAVATLARRRELDGASSTELPSSH